VRPNQLDMTDIRINAIALGDLAVALRVAGYESGGAFVAPLGAIGVVALSSVGARGAHLIGGRGQGERQCVTTK